MIEALRVNSLKRSFGPGPAAVDEIDLAVDEGCFFCLLGPSGCGKTTLLRMIGGYLMPTSGEVFIAGARVTRHPPERRNVGMVFQNYALFPHLSARENVAFGLEVRKVSRRECQRRVEAILDRVGLSEAERQRYPKQLSGGQQQRVALARALVIEPHLLLLDEPLANLDRKLRERLRGELRGIQRRTGVTTILVTHDQEEAFAMADQVGVMVQGKFLQVDSPSALYHQPATPAVARFVGEANLFQVKSVTSKGTQLLGGVSLPALPKTVVPGTWLLVRPENCVVGQAALSCFCHWQAQVVESTFLGSDRLLEVEIAPGTVLKVRGRPEMLFSVRVGDSLPVGFERAHLWIVPKTDPAWALSLLATNSLQASPASL